MVDPFKRGKVGTDSQSSALASVQAASEESQMPWREGLKPNKRPGTINAIPFNIGPKRPNHPKIYGGAGRGGGKTRHQLT